MPKHDIRPRRLVSDASSKRTVGILLLPEFPLMAYACNVEPLRAANTLSRRRLYRWVNLSVDGAPTRIKRRENRG